MADLLNATAEFDRDRSQLHKGAGSQIGMKAEHRHHDLFLAHASLQGPGYVLPRRKYRA